MYFLFNFLKTHRRGTYITFILQYTRFMTIKESLVFVWKIPQFHHYWCSSYINVIIRSIIMNERSFSQTFTEGRVRRSERKSCFLSDTRRDDFYKYYLLIFRSVQGNIYQGEPVSNMTSSVPKGILYSCGETILYISNC